MNVGDKISNLRRGKNLTQEQLGELLGVSRQSVSKWESGLAFPETIHLIELSKIFDCSIDYLLKEETIQSNNIKPSSETQVVGLIRKHWRKVYIPMYFGGTISTFMGIFLMVVSNSFANMIGNIFLNDKVADYTKAMINTYKTVISGMGIFVICLGVVLIIIASVLLVKEKKANRY